MQCTEQPINRFCRKADTSDTAEVCAALRYRIERAARAEAPRG